MSVIVSAPSQHRQKAKQQHLVEGIQHLSRLPRVRQIVEIAQKDNRLSERLTIGSNAIHRKHPLANQRTSTDSALQTLVIYFFTRLPWRGRAIALGDHQRAS